MVNLLRMLNVKKTIFKLLLIVDRLHISYMPLQYLIGVKIYKFNISKVFVIIVVEVFSFEPIFKMSVVLGGSS